MKNRKKQRRTDREARTGFIDAALSDGCAARNFIQKSGLKGFVPMPMTSR
jgi:hypothetical protein